MPFSPPLSETPYNPSAQSRTDDATTTQPYVAHCHLGAASARAVSLSRRSTDLPSDRIRSNAARRSRADFSASLAWLGSAPGPITGSPRP